MNFKNRLGLDIEFIQTLYSLMFLHSENGMRDDQPGRIRLV